MRPLVPFSGHYFVHTGLSEKSDSPVCFISYDCYVGFDIRQKSWPAIAQSQMVTETLARSETPEALNAWISYKKTVGSLVRGVVRSRNLLP